MNKWIEQEAKQWMSDDSKFTCDPEKAYTAGAQAVLAKVKEIVEKAGTEKFYFDALFDDGRESLRKEILKELSDPSLGPPNHP